jgi:hypothetical protein
MHTSWPPRQLVSIGRLEIDIAVGFVSATTLRNRDLHYVIRVANPLWWPVYQNQLNEALVRAIRGIKPPTVVLLVEGARLRSLSQRSGI